MEKFTITAKELSEKTNLTVQKIYTLRDCSTNSAQSKPLLKQNVHWKFKDGRFVFTHESLSIVKEWKDSHFVPRKKRNT